MIDLTHLAISSPVSYLIALLLPAFDALIPILPSETAIITLGVATAGSADPRIALLVALAAAGAFLGDNITYLVGRRLGPLINRRIFAGEKGAKRREWAEQALSHYGARIIVVCRFIPGGRTAVMLTCGLIGFNRRVFVAATAFAGVLWACYAFFIGRVGGQAFEDRPWAGLLLAFGIALAASAIIELFRRFRPWRWFGLGRDNEPGPAPVSSGPAGSGPAGSGPASSGSAGSGSAGSGPADSSGSPDSPAPAGTPGSPGAAGSRPAGDPGSDGGNETGTETERVTASRIDQSGS
ncbi:MAG TPA: DedA family protein [Streptosporangiaceae bacterium]|nr:DedA family protein [Streptosporangiaceae bacterium]